MVNELNSCEETGIVSFPRIMITAEKSGGGKTLFTCALLGLLKEKIREVRAFKCGPDYIDPMFHKTVLEVPSRNLDSFFTDPDTLRYLLGREVLENREFSKSRIAVMEGAMGFYDGLGGVSTRSSAWEVAHWTDTPVILLVDMKGRSLSALASLSGFFSFEAKSHIAGVIFTRTSAMLYQRLKDEVQKRLGIRSFGFVPELENLPFTSRHLGLVMPEEIADIRHELDEIKEKIRLGIDLDGIIDAARAAANFRVSPVKIRNFWQIPVAVARDSAFCFYYEDNLDLLRKMGANIRYFSPIHDKMLPRDACALYLGGGYPELYAGALSENISMQVSVRKAIESGMPCLAECGGYLYLKESLTDPDGRKWPMAGLLSGNSKNTGKLKRFGYVTVTAKRDGLLGPKGTSFPAHEFHHWDSEENGKDFEAKKPVGKRAWDCAYTTDSLYAGFPHLYFYGNPNIAEAFLKKADEWKKRGKINGKR